MIIFCGQPVFRNKALFVNFHGAGIAAINVGDGDLAGNVLIEFLKLRRQAPTIPGVPYRPTF